ncbi:MAG TPA: aminomethyl-transferring glycine dehydrogenase subunit GcvPA [Sediminispirochaeta sp.]|nr:aminomethyl-transferring glycine dehydrogenase subunit GcvPA [Sediminispirochaeta sp.]
MFAYLPHTEDEIKQMLDDIGASSVDELFADIPEAIRFKGTLDLPKGQSELEVFKRLNELAQKNKQAVSFMGAGSYDHLIPSTVGALMGRTEFYTSYTPYQPEISQGVLQAIFEFQTLMCELTSLDVSNASLYDGSTAASEACALAINSTRKTDTVLYSATIHPYTKQVMETYFADLDVKLVELPSKDGVLDLFSVKENLDSSVAALLVQSPNVYGYLEDYTGVADLLHENKSLFIISSNPMSLGALKSQGEWGADIAIGDTQPFGLPSYYGGPSVGYIAAREKLLRKMPGRIVGQTVDEDGKRAFVLTLQAREQHIKRERATSNICSNQALAALASTVYLSTVGREGLKELSEQNMQKAHYFFDRLMDETGAEEYAEQPFFNEFCIKVPMDARKLVKEMEKDGIFAGVPMIDLDPSQSENLLLVAVTEKRTVAEMDRYIESMKGVLK